jgi:hypothetical protein
MIRCRPIQDRRRGDRPSNGDKKSCPKCGTSTIEFSERYRLPEASGCTVAWVCDSPGCGYSEPVRDLDRAQIAGARRRMASMHLRPVHRKKSG